MSAIIFDCETTGTDDPVIVETSYCRLAHPCPDTYLHPGEYFTNRWSPGKKIGFGAMATHHITNEDVAFSPPSQSFVMPKCDYLIGHNIDFDWEVIGSPPAKRICTFALSKKMWPESDSHKQWALIYMLDRKFALKFAREAHGAQRDVEACFIILKHILTKLGHPKSWEAVWRSSEEARIPETIWFGKHKGAKIADIPRDYMRWYLNQADRDPWLVIAMERVLSPKRQAAGLFQ